MKALGLGMAVLLAGGCARRVDTSEGAGQSVSASTYYPLAVGNRWTYRVKLLGEEQQRQVEILRQDDAYFVDNMGGQLTADAFGIRDAKRYLLREPIEVGREWTNVVSVSSVEHYRILETAVSCEVPAGKFQGCVKVECRNRVDAGHTLVNQLTFAPGVGLVKIEVSAESGETRIPQAELVLESFKLAGGKTASGSVR